MNEDDEAAETLDSIKTAERLSGAKFNAPEMKGHMLATTGFEENGRITSKMLEAGMMDLESENMVSQKKQIKLSQESQKQKAAKDAEEKKAMKELAEVSQSHFNSDEEDEGFVMIRFIDGTETLISESGAIQK